MTDKDCIAWMEEEGILHCWIRPELGCNNEIIIADSNGTEKINRYYKGKPVGDYPEAMPLDNYLFRDLCCCFDTHVILTYNLPSCDLQRFSKATPKEMRRVVEHLWDPDTGVVPCSRRIIQDVECLPENFWLVVEANRAIVPGVCDHNGHRCCTRDTEKLSGGMMLCTLTNQQKV